MNQLKTILRQLRRSLKQLNLSRYKDIYTQLAINKAKLEATQNQLHKDPQHQQLQPKEREDRIRFLDILDSSIKLMHQQSKLQWLHKDDQCTKFFFAKMKQRKQANYIYSINCANKNKTDGFLDVARAITNFYQQLLGKQKVGKPRMKNNSIT
ncbi:hypothetical protein Cgig2_008872 [Carnegiea gigantea]|uniref:Uncharacterized protein n=1 Tax=Carnegiea gigantea TaxID=171969 RepID=A0A9Q1JFP6_9CARY|nr:hypothetical protein Cgig2_008872 [Carnegiea gigantea]